MTDAERLLRDPSTRRCLAAMSGEEGTTLDDLLSCYQSADDANYHAFAEAVGIKLVAIEPEEQKRISSGLKKLAVVEAEEARQAEQDARTFAERDAREQAAADRLWPSFAAALGLEP